MNVIILKTNINNEQKLNCAQRVFESIPQIKKWSVDQEDVDKVLRIEATKNLVESTIIHLLSMNGLVCQELE